MTNHSQPPGGEGLPEWKSGSEFAPYHPQASHVSYDYRDGWNHCFEAARAEVERLTSELAVMTDDRDSWLKQADDRTADALRFAAEADALKAAKPDVNSIMALADEMVRKSWAEGERGHEYHAARTALRAALEGTCKSDLQVAARAVVERWDTPLWKDAPATAVFINRLRATLEAKP